MSTAGKAVRAGWCAVLAVVMVACSNSVDEQSGAAVTGVSDAMLADAAHFQTAAGLFLMPEATAATVTGFVATGQYAAVATSTSGVVDFARAAANPLPDAADLAEIDAYLQVQGAAGAAELDPDTARRVAAGIVLPPEQADAGAEIGALWLWSDAVSRARSLGVDVAVDASGADRLAAIPVSAVAGHPYLIDRLADVHDHLAATVPADLASLAGTLADTDPPTSLDSTSAVLDLVAVERHHAGAGTSTELPSATTDRLVALAAGPEGTDDLLRSAVVEILSLAHADARAAEVVAALSTRVDPASGLLGPAGGATGSVDATYLFARLVDLRFGEIASAATRDALASAAADTQASPSSRLEAVAALKNAGDDRWQQYRQLATDVAAARPATVDQTSLGDYLQVMEPAVQVDPDIRTATLTAFDPGADESTQRLAWAALRLSYLFANEPDVAGMFAGLQLQMKSWADTPTTPFPQLLAAAAIIPGSRVVSSDSSYLEALGARIAGHRGCRDAGTFFALDGTSGGTCSVILTLQSRGVPGGAA